MVKESGNNAGFSSSFFAYAKDLKTHIEQIRLAAKDSIREVKETVGRSKGQFHADFPGLGGNPDEDGQVIDIGKKRNLGMRLVQGGAGLVVMGLMVGGVLTFTLFALQIALAFFIAVHVLGIRIDLNPLHQHAAGEV